MHSCTSEATSSMRNDSVGNSCATAFAFAQRNRVLRTLMSDGCHPELPLAQPHQACLASASLTANLCKTDI
eukprot:1139847-Pelagomonas_calceolata.AAC.7